MWDFKTAQVFQGKQYFSLKNQMEHDCKGARSRVLSTTAFSGHMGKGNVVISDSAPAWTPVRPGSGTPAEAFSKIACAGK
jgi:surface-adhesin protein E